jgi:hypothetical protein
MSDSLREGYPRYKARRDLWWASVDDTQKTCPLDFLGRETGREFCSMIEEYCKFNRPRFHGTWACELSLDGHCFLTSMSDFQTQLLYKEEPPLFFNEDIEQGG